MPIKRSYIIFLFLFGISNSLVGQGAGTALDFDGSNDYVSIPDNDLWAIGSIDFSVLLWARFDSPGGTLGNPGDVLVSNDQGGGNVPKWWFGLGNGQLHLHINGPVIGPDWFPLQPFSPTIGQWYHLAITRGGDTYTVYVNGVTGEQSVNTDVIQNPSIPLYIGQAEGFYFDGQIDEVSIWHKALTRDEI